MSEKSAFKTKKSEFYSEYRIFGRLVKICNQNI